MQQTVWIVGAWQHADFVAALNWLNIHAQCAAFATVADALVAAPPCPASILIFQSRPGQISHRDIEQLHAAAPLARLVAFLGPWCEGEMRSGQPWPGVTRVPWRTWSSRLPRELGLETSRSSARLPRTATEVERLDSGIATLRRRPAQILTVEICTANRSEFESLREALVALGMNAIWRRPEQRSEDSVADVILIDGWRNAGEFAENLPPRIVLLHFPRPEDINRAAVLGITSVIARPLLIADLAATLDDVLPPAVHESAA